MENSALSQKIEAIREEIKSNVDKLDSSKLVYEMRKSPAGEAKASCPHQDVVLGSKSHDDTPAPPPAQRPPPQPRPHPDCPLLYSTLGPGQRSYLHGRKV